MSARRPATGRAAAAESWVQIGLMLAVGVVAACASWSHVLHLASAHGQSGWLAWAVAACVETAAVSAGLEVRRRRRSGQSARLPIGVLVVATVLQLAAQVAEAERTVWGVILAAVPALTFLVLVKLAMGRGGDAVPEVAGASRTVQARSVDRTPRPAPPTALSVAPGQPDRAVSVPRQPSGVAAASSSSAGPRTSSPVLPQSAPTAAGRTGKPRPDVSDLLPHGRQVAEEVARTGGRLTRAVLVAELRARGHSVSSDRAGALLAELRAA